MNLEALARHDVIRVLLETEGLVRVADLASRFEVSEMTIRRDLDLIAEEGAIRRVRGGAISVGPQSFETRFRQNATAKSRVAEKLADLVGVGGAIALDASSTLQRLAARLDSARDLTVLTNGPETFTALSEHTNVTALLTGGALDRRTGSLVGPLAARAARDVLLRRLFVSAAAVDPQLGTSEMTLEEAEIKLALAESATEVILAVDASKLDHRAPARGFALDRIDVLVTDLDPDDPKLDGYRKQVRSIV